MKQDPLNFFSLFCFVFFFITFFCVFKPDFINLRVIVKSALAS